MSENETQVQNEQATEVQAESNGTTPAEDNIQRGPFETAEQAEGAAQKAKATTGKAYKVWETTSPAGQVHFSIAIDSARGTLAVVKGLGWKTTLVGGKGKAKAAPITAESVETWLANLSPEERAAAIAKFAQQAPAEQPPAQEEQPPADQGNGEQPAPKKGKGRKGKAAEQPAE